MHDPLLAYLNAQEGNDFVFINDILKTDEQYKGKSLEELRLYLNNLVSEDTIQIKENKHKRIGQPSKINENILENVTADLNNWIMLAKITSKGKSNVWELEKKDIDYKLAKKQLDDYPKEIRRRQWALRSAIIVAIITAIGLLSKLKCGS